MIAVPVLHDNTESFPRRRESIEYDSSSDVGWAKRSVPNALDASIPDVCQATCPNCQTAKSESPHTVFQVAGHTCVECSLGFVAHDVERGLSYDCAPLWIPAFAGMTGEAFVGMAGRSLWGWRESMIAVLVLLDNTASFPRRRESMVALLVLRDNTASFPRRRESIEYDSSSDVGWAKRNVPNTQMLPFPRFVRLLVRIAKLPSPSPHIRFFRLLVTPV